MINRVILLSDRDASRVNQQIIGGRYLVFNAPWHSSPANTDLRRVGCEIHIESQDTVCRISGGKIIHLESVYAVDEAVRFTEIVPSPPSYDFFLEKRCFLNNLSGDIGPGEGAVVHLERRRPMRFVAPIMLCVFRDVVEHILVEIPERVVRHITNQPMGVKQNTAIKTTLGSLLRVSCSSQRLAIRLGYPVVFVNNMYLLPTYGYLVLFSFLYSVLTTSFIEVVQLLNNSSYNPLKRRRDSIILGTDQIFMSAVMFSFYLLIVMNVICFQAFFVFMSLCLISLKFVSDFIDFVSMDTSHCSTYNLVIDKDNASEPELRYTSVSTWAKIVFAVEASFRVSELCRDRFLVRLLFGT